MRYLEHCQIVTLTLLVARQSSPPRSVEVRSEELLRQLSYAIKNHLGHQKPSTRGFGTQRQNGSLLAPRWFAYNRTFPCMEATYPLSLL